MPVYAITVTRTAHFGLDCDNMLQAQASARSALRELGDAVVWTEEVTVDGEIAPEDIFDD